MRKKLLQILFSAIRVALQMLLVFIMVACVFCFSISFAQPSINRYQMICTLLLVVASYCFIKLSVSKAHKHFASYVVMLTSVMWLLVIAHETLF